MATLALEKNDAPTAETSNDTGAWPSSQPSSRSPWTAVLLSLVAVGALLTVLFVRNHRYFFVDDRISGELPTYVDMGRILLSGEWPWLSTNVVNSGARAIEYATGVFNPLNLVMSVALTQFNDAALGAFVYILVHALLLTGAAAWLARLVGLNTAWSVAFAISVGFQPYTVVWDFTAWGQGLSSFAWFVLAVAAAFAFHLEPKRRYGWLILFATYGAFTSGWPLVVPVLGFFAAALIVSRLLARAPMRATVWLAAWFAGGAVCSLVAIYPLLTSSEFATRTTAVANTGNFNVVSLEGLLQFANPGYYGFFLNFGGYALQPLPHFYVAWFILPVLLFWKGGSFRAPIVVLLQVTLAALVLSFVGVLGPETLGSFRFPTRFLQYTGFFLLLLTALLVAHGCFVFTRRRLYAALAVVSFLVVNALQTNPTGADRILLFGGLLAGLCAIVWWHGSAGVRGRADGRSAPSWALADGAVLGGTMVILLGLALLHPSGRGVDWGFPHDLSAMEPLSQQDYTLFYGNYLPPDSGVDAFREYRPATTGLLVGDRQINGYTSLGNSFFRQYFPIDDHGNFAPGAAASFTQVDPVSGLTMLELLRVDQIVAQLGPMNDDLRPLLDDDWRFARSGDITATYRRDDFTLPGLVSYASPGLDVDEVPGCEQGHSKECVGIEQASDRPGEVVFARLWFPGYRATLDGEPVAIERHADMLVSAVIPPGETGNLVLTYRSPGFYEFGGLALLVLASLAFASYRFSTVGSQSDPQRRRSQLLRAVHGASAGRSSRPSSRAT